MTMNYYNGPCTPTCICPSCCPTNSSSSQPANTIAGAVALATGMLTLPISTMVASSIGSTGLALAIEYSACRISQALAGIGVDLSTFIQMLPGSAILSTGLNSQEHFSDLGGGHYSSANNNSAATVTRTGVGTSADTFTMVARDGTVSRFLGFDPSVPTPGVIQSITDRNGNTQTYAWTPAVVPGGRVQLATVSDGYGRVTHFTYYGPEASYRLKTVTDFLGRRTDFAYDTHGHLISLVTPSVTRGADNNANTFPGGMAYVFEYDVNNPRLDRRDDLLKVFYPNQTQPHVNTATGVVDMNAVYASGTPRMSFEYGQDPTDVNQYGRVLRSTIGNSVSGVGGSYQYLYLTTGLPANQINPSDPIVSRTVVTDRNGNQTLYDFNAANMPVRIERIATRTKNSLQAASWITWTKYNSHNQPTLVVMPEGNSVAYTYEDETTAPVINGLPYARRFGLLRGETRFPGNTIGVPTTRAGSGPAGGVQQQLTRTHFYDPLFSQLCATIEERGNPIDAGGDYFPPQNGAATPTNGDRSRYATITTFDYQKDTLAAVQSDPALQAMLGLTAAQIGQLISYVDSQMKATDGTGGLPAGFAMGLGDINGEGTGSGTAGNAAHAGNVIKVQHPSVRQLVPNAGSGDPWAWQTQLRTELFTVNAKGQTTTHTDPEGNLNLYIRYPESDPEGDGMFGDVALSNKQYGRVKQIHVDADPNSVMSLIGSDGDLITFTPNLIARTNTPGSYLDLVTEHQSSPAAAGCSSCAYDPLGNPTINIDPRGFTTTYERNELGQVYRVTGPAPYNYQTETWYDANGNVTRVDTQDQQVKFDSSDPSDPRYGQFTPTGSTTLTAGGSGSVAQVPSQPGPGGSVRPGWFTNLLDYDLLDNKIEEDVDATGSNPSSLMTKFAYDPNQNLANITRPLGNTIEYDYDERNLKIAQRLGYDPATNQQGAVTVWSFDGNGNVIDVIGPADRTGNPGTRLSAILDDAFGLGSALVHTGDWVTQNVYDGFDRLIQSTDAVGGIATNTYDPSGRVIASAKNGTAGGASPTDRSGSANVPLSSSAMFFDEAGRLYDHQQNVFLNTGISVSTPTHMIPSGRAITHTGGGLAANSTANSNTATVTLTTGGQSYILSRSVFDRAGRVTASATDNGAITTFAYDGANRQILRIDPLNNQVQTSYDANGNAVGVTRIETCTISSGIAPEK